MEAREITIVSTKTQKKSVILSAATTLAELKQDLTANNIDYTGMAFYEGISKVELKTDNSILPHDVPYKGKTTNKLVFMLTNMNKEISSGVMSRKELYAAIKDNNLQKKCIEKFGKNYTQCQNDQLNSLIKEFYNNSAPVYKDEDSTPVVTKNDNKKKTTSVHNEVKVVNVVDSRARKAILKLVDLLYQCELMCYSDKCEILKTLEIDENTTLSSYSDEEIEDMFREFEND